MDPETIKPIHDRHSTNPHLRPRYSGIASFFRCEIVETLAGLESIDIGIIGVPFDEGVTNRSGCRHGPRAVREHSTMMRLHNQATKVSPFTSRVADLGDIWIEKPFELVGALKEIEDFMTRIKENRVIPLTVGGDHSISLAILRAVAKDGPVGLIHLDSHCDTGDDYLGSKYHHGAVFRRATEENLIDPKRTVQIGIRGSLNDLDMWNFSYDSGMRVIHMEEFNDKGWRWAAQEAKNIVGNGPTYLTVDIDVLDPAFAPGTGTPEPGGLTMIEAQRLIRELGDDVDLIGADLVEVAPPFDSANITAINAAGLLFEMLCVLHQAKCRRATKSVTAVTTNPANAVGSAISISTEAIPEVMPSQTPNPTRSLEPAKIPDTVSVTK